MRKRRSTTHIVIHCADTPNGSPGFTVDDIRQWHVDENGWLDIGYQYVVHADGEVKQGRPLDAVGAHCPGFNARSVGICMIGRSKYTVEQWASLATLVKELWLEYQDARVVGHNEYSTKLCPGFSVQEWYKGALAPLEAHVCALKGER